MPAQSRGMSMNKLVEQISAHALAAWNKENHFRAMAATEDGEAATRSNLQRTGYFLAQVLNLSWEPWPTHSSPHPTQNSYALPLRV